MDQYDPQYRAEKMQEGLNRLVDALEDLGPSVMARPRAAGGWEIHFAIGTDDEEEPPLVFQDWERMHLVHATQAVRDRGWCIPEDVHLAGDRHGGWAHHLMPSGGYAWTAPVYRSSS